MGMTSCTRDAGPSTGRAWAKMESHPRIPADSGRSVRVHLLSAPSSRPAFPAPLSLLDLQAVDRLKVLLCLVLQRRRDNSVMAIQASAPRQIAPRSRSGATDF